MRTEKGWGNFIYPSPRPTRLPTGIVHLPCVPRHGSKMIIGKGHQDKRRLNSRLRSKHGSNTIGERVRRSSKEVPSPPRPEPFPRQPSKGSPQKNMRRRVQATRKGQTCLTLVSVMTIRLKRSEEDPQINFAAPPPTLKYALVRNTLIRSDCISLGPAVRPYPRHGINTSTTTHGPQPMHPS